MPTAILEQPRLGRRSPTAQATERAHHRREWLAAGLALAFALPYVLTDLFTINRDLYYGLYATAVFGFFALWLRLAVEAPRALLTRNWRWGALLGVIFAGATAAIAFNPTSCSRPPAARSSSASATRNLERPAARVGAVLESADSHSGRSGRDHLFSFALGPRRARRQ